MTQDNKSINSHIETYLDYYCGLSHTPGFAVLLKGQWGSGKTWFINKYREKIKQLKKKALYVSLYGITNFSEIENAFFQQLHPVLSSKPMKIAGKMFQGMIQAYFKIDINSDAKDDISVNIKTPDINLPKYLQNIDKSILIFDDLERCQIDIGNILGYINYFVEHQGLKVVIVANEDKLLENSNYKDIREKLIGKTFDVCLDLHGALQDFIEYSNNSELKSFLYKNSKLIEKLYHQAGFENLRALKQIILDFERIFENLPDKAKSKIGLIQDLLKLLTVFSIEIKRGIILPKDISKLQEAQTFELTQATAKARRNYTEARSKTKTDQEKLSTLPSNEDTQQLNSLKKLIDRYRILDLYLYEPFPNLAWWQTFFDKGIIDTQELEHSIFNSIYFQDENTPNWVRLWHFNDLSDDEFDGLLKNVESDYYNRKFTNIQEIKHVTGIFLRLSDIELYSKSKEDLLEDSKLYINCLKKNNKLNLNITERSLPSLIESMIGYKGLEFQGKQLEEFQLFCSYIQEVRHLAIEEKMPILAQELLEIMQNDQWQFYTIICLNDFTSSINNVDELHSIYYKIPLLQFIQETDFTEKLLSMDFKNQSLCCSGLRQRYESDEINKKLFKELEWLKSVRNLLLEEAIRRKGKPSGYRPEVLIKKYLNEAISMLEKED
ncbi:NTPase [Mastigocoleus testarum BC008]|uniref:NTPase n=2 Tax=Mastigocoleus TaxID=996924 RepID=A0A0V7ZQA2_9CYAN|nr:NTPase [Mastigocoleus testarum BC008]